MLSLNKYLIKIIAELSCPWRLRVCKKLKEIIDLELSDSIIVNKKKNIYGLPNI